LLEDQALGLLSSVTIDELHMVGDAERGYQLELLLQTALRGGHSMGGKWCRPCAAGRQRAGAAVTSAGHPG